MSRMTDIQSERDQLFFRLCSDHISIEAIPKKPVRVDFAKFKDRSLRNYELIMWTPHFVVLKNRSGQEITLRKDGRMVIRKAASESVAELAATAVMRLVLNDFLEG